MLGVEPVIVLEGPGPSIAVFLYTKKFGYAWQQEVTFFPWTSTKGSSLPTLLPQGTFPGILMDAGWLPL